MSGSTESLPMTYLGGYHGSDAEENRAVPVSSDVESPREMKRNVLAFAKKESSPFFYYVYVALLAILGCFIRILLDILFGEVAKVEDPARMINNSFISNIVACFLVGILNGSPLKDSKFKALYKGLTIGFCGSLSTFSNWNQQLSLLLVNETPSTSSKQVMAMFGYFVGLFSFCASYSFGRNVSKLIRKRSAARGTARGRSFTHIIITILLILSFAVFALVMLLELPEKSKAIFLALIFAPFAACIRKRLIRVRISKNRLPIGTLIVNVIGATLVALLHVVVSRLSPYSSCEGVLICWPNVVAFAFKVGFCGTLSTVPGFTAEFFDIRMRDQTLYAYLYIILTLITSQLLAGVINGINYSYM